MSILEFDLIQRYFAKQPTNPVNRLGVGDDCALMSIPVGYELAITTDTMVEGVHFSAGANPRLLGHKLLAVNLSDLAAMGAKPVSVTLALTIPTTDEHWLTEFAQGFLNLAHKFSVDLIGGDTCSGPLTLTVQALGLVPKGRSLKRCSAKLGDLIFVTGCLGDAGLGLKIEAGYLTNFVGYTLKHLHQPEPRVTEGLVIRNYANACIDLSDGIASDLKHILNNSNVGATLDWNKLPFSKEVHEYIKATDDWQMPLLAGDDYELCFTVSPENINYININCTKIGVINDNTGLEIRRFGVTEELALKGFEHFS